MSLGIIPMVGELLKREEFPLNNPRGWSVSDATATVAGVAIGTAIGVGIIATAATAGPVVMESAVRIYEKMDISQGTADTLSQIPATIGYGMVCAVAGAAAKTLYDKTGGCFTQ